VQDNGGECDVGSTTGEANLSQFICRDEGEQKQVQVPLTRIPR